MAGASSITFPNLGFLGSQERDFCGYSPYAVEGLMSRCQVVLTLYDGEAFGKGE